MSRNGGADLRDRCIRRSNSVSHLGHRPWCSSVWFALTVPKSRPLGIRPSSDKNPLAILSNESVVPIVANVLPSHAVATLVGHNPSLDPSPPGSVCQCQFLSFENADAVCSAQFFDVEYPSETLRHGKCLPAAMAAFHRPSPQSSRTAYHPIMAVQVRTLFDQSCNRRSCPIAWCNFARAELLQVVGSDISSNAAGNGAPGAPSAATHFLA